MPNREELLRKIEEILSQHLDNDDLKLTEESTADQVEGWDSINHVRLLLGLEREFGIRFETEEVNDVSNVGELIDLVERKLKS